MDKRILNLKKPMGIVGSPYNVICPTFHPPIVKPCPPPPPPQINITVNNDDDDFNSIEQNKIDTNQNQSINSISGKIIEIEKHLNDIEINNGSLSLGEEPGMAYPGEKGKLNAANITIINNQLADLLTNGVKKDDLLEYATNENLSDQVIEINNTINNVENKIPTSLSSFSDYNKVETLEESVNNIKNTAVTQSDVSNLVDEKITNSNSLNVTIESKVEQHIKETNQAEDESLSSLVDLVNDLNVKI